MSLLMMNMVLVQDTHCAVRIKVKLIPDYHAIPYIHDTLKESSSSSVLDQRKVYHQDFLVDSSHVFTAFITPWRLCELIRIIFGLSSTPAEFQRSMEQCLPSLDDNLVHSQTSEDIIYEAF